MSAVRKIAANTISSVPSVTQDAAVHALEACARVNEMRIDFEKRTALLVERLNNMGLSTLPPHGAFYSFANVSSLFGSDYAGRKLENSADVALAMLRDAHVAGVAGQAFGEGEYVRFSCVRPIAELDAACDALEAFVLRHRRATEPARAAAPVPSLQPVSA